MSFIYPNVKFKLPQTPQQSRRRMSSIVSAQPKIEECSYSVKIHELSEDLACLQSKKELNDSDLYVKDTEGGRNPSATPLKQSSSDE